MAALSAILAGGAVASGGLGLASAYSQAEATKQAGAFNAKQMEMNARLSDLQADDSIRRGDNEAAQVKKQAKQMVGSQRAALAAQGIEVDSGTAADIQADTQDMGEIDAMTVKNNAWREAWGFKQQALNSSGQAMMTRAESANKARNTLLTGGMQAIQSGIQAGSYMRK